MNQLRWNKLAASARDHVLIHQDMETYFRPAGRSVHVQVYRPVGKTYLVNRLSTIRHVLRSSRVVQKRRGGHARPTGGRIP